MKLTTIKLSGLKRSLSYLLNNVELPPMLLLRVRSNISEVAPKVDEATAIEQEIGQQILAKEEDEDNENENGALSPERRQHLELLLDEYEVELKTLPWDLIQGIEITFQDLCGLKPIIENLPDEVDDQLDYYDIEDKVQKQVDDILG